MTRRLSIEGRRAFSRLRNVGATGLARSLWRAAVIKRQAALRPASKSDERVVVSLTTTPRRARHVASTLASLLDQTIAAHKILLALPEKTASGENYPELSELRLPGSVEVVRCLDRGPATKLLPALSREPSALLVAVDDDVIYPRRFLECLLAEHRLRPAAAIGFRGVRLSQGIPYRDLDHVFSTGINESRQVDILFGTWGYLVPPGSFGEEVHLLDQAPEELKWADDIWFSGHLARRGVERWVAKSDQLPIETLNVWRASLAGSRNSDGKNDAAGLLHFGGDW